MYSPLLGIRHYDADILRIAWMEPPMNVPDLVRQCVLFLGNKDEKTKQFRPRATAFVVSITEGDLGFRYLVTAEHNVTKFLTANWDFWLRSNTKSGGIQEDKFVDPRWYFHPDAERSPTDVAVLPIDFTEDEEFKMVPIRKSEKHPEAPGAIAATTEVLKENHLGLGDEIFITGLFRSHAGRQRNIPIIRIGNLAMMRGEPVHTTYCGFTDAYLVEARSIGGLSGSPVFIHKPLFQIIDGVVRASSGNQYYLLGLMHGHFDIKNLNEDTAVDDEAEATRGINTGIGVVIPVEKILETIDHPELVEMRKEAAKEHREKNGATPDFGDDAPPATDVPPSDRERFNQLLSAAARKPARED